MTTLLTELLSNRVLWATGIAWVSTQTIKVLLSVKRQKRFDFRWFLGTGGMPSAHSAGVSALATGVGIEAGFDTVSFAVATAFAMVTMFDAQGVRRSAGRQAIVLNKILDEISAGRQISEERVKELLGHTPVEVFIGSLMGIILAISFCRTP
ncbi:MAG: divergent PAP2 family protein [Candidatus Omnitrophica bacterium]|nr:divergent PAP2 family protein [Candidatus Omnitrophota bacterium]